MLIFLQNNNMKKYQVYVRNRELTVTKNLKRNMLQIDKVYFVRLCASGEVIWLKLLRIKTRSTGLYHAHELLRFI